MFCVPYTQDYEERDFGDDDDEVNDDDDYDDDDEVKEERGRCDEEDENEG